ncbi:hypothetical protein KQX54_019198 [Cotesia glomerata]|uniref:Uncharacterized protein n=1 Tax=Cotesia glomerata TaxID=32391 RepID=A0AAV7IP97_COTGL|nr:hypothetical protein KQX54_019198 [Cotesia glomerata]
MPLVLKLLISDNICSTNPPRKKLSSSNSTSQKKKVNERSYGSIVMLTFTKDGEDIQEYLSNIPGTKSKIGVLILQKQRKDSSPDEERDGNYSYADGDTSL